MFSTSFHAAPCGLSRYNIIDRLSHRRAVARIARLLAYFPLCRVIGRIAVSVAVLGLWSVLLASFGMGVM